MTRRAEAHLMLLVHAIKAMNENHPLMLIVKLPPCIPFQTHIICCAFYSEMRDIVLIPPHFILIWRFRSEHTDATLLCPRYRSTYGTNDCQIAVPLSYEASW